MQAQAEQYLGTAIEPQEWDSAKRQAERKLERTIEREGDLDGARREPWYLAQLIAEVVRAGRFSRFAIALISLDQYAEKQIKRQKPAGTKKGQPHTFTV